MHELAAIDALCETHLVSIADLRFQGDFDKRLRKVLKRQHTILGIALREVQRKIA